MLFAGQTVSADGSERGTLLLLLVAKSYSREIALRELLAQAKSLRFEVVHTALPASARQVVARQQFHLILLDLEDDADYSTVALLRDAAAGAPIIVVGNSSGGTAELTALRHGADSYLAVDQIAPGMLEHTLECALARQHANAPHRGESVTGAGEGVATHSSRATNTAEEALRHSEERLRLMIDSVEDYAIYMLDPLGHVVSWNLGAGRIKGYSAAEIVGRHYSAFYTEEDRLREKPTLMLRRATEGGRAADEGWRVRKDGSRFWASVVISAVHDQSGTLIGFVKVTRDMSERRKAEEALRESEERYHSLFEQSLDAILLTSSDGRIIAANPAATKMFKLSEGDLLELGLEAVVDSHDERLDQLIAERERSGVAQGELLLKRSDGSHFPAEIRSTAFYDNAGKLHTSMFLHDVTEQKRITEELTHRAFYDQLTRLPNRALFMDRLNQQVQHAKRDTSRIFAVLFIDVDRFKLINDSLGHQTGDLLLCEIAERLRECVRANDTVARLGGDEFTVLLDGIDQLKSATMIADRIEAVLEQPFHLAGHEVFVTASVGIAISSSDYKSAEELLRDADTAMYRAKGTGRGRYVVFDAAMHQAAMQTLELEAALRRAVERGEFEVHYQPIVGLESGQVEGFEALVRWRRGARGLVAPADFLPLAEETGLILAIDWWVLGEACRRLSLEHGRSGGAARCWVSVNFSARHFAEPGLVLKIAQILHDTSLPPTCLRLEITESAFVEEVPSLHTTFAQLRDLGVQLHLDDFGTGYSSLSYLHRFRVDALKVDKSFVDELTRPGAGSEIVRATITLAHSMGLQVVAEGVQTAEQWNLLRQLGCDRAQGYYFARPAARLEFELDLTAA